MTHYTTDYTALQMSNEEGQSTSDMIARYRSLAYERQQEVARQLVNMNQTELEAAVGAIRAGRIYDPALVALATGAGFLTGMVLQMAVDVRLTSCLPVTGLAGLIPIGVGMAVAQNQPAVVRNSLGGFGAALAMGTWVYAQQNPLEAPAPIIQGEPNP